MIRRFAPLLLLALCSSACLEQAQASVSNPADRSPVSYVAPAPLVPQRPQICGEDGGLVCAFIVDAGSCLRLSTTVDVQYIQGDFDRFPDGGLFLKPDATLYTLEDGGAVTYSDGGTYPDAGVYLGGPYVAPKMNDLFANQVENECLVFTQSRISVQLSAAGKFKLSNRGP